ncbi:MAG: response regulator receiver protein [Acidobacteriales bacterium]|nr:response regulator receiver protein [Terriglobales bacterium]
MSLEALIVSTDKEVVSGFRRVLVANSINLSAVTSVKQASGVLEANKFDAIIVDCDDLPGGSALLETLRKAESSKSAVIFAVLNNVTSSKKAYEMGSNFVLEKPLTADRISRSVRAGRGLILKERRKFFRYAVGADAYVTVGHSEQLKGRVVNLSEGGVALELNLKDAPKGPLSTKFQLPGSAVPIEGKCEVQWANAGQLGLLFTQMTPESRQELTRWLTRKIESKAPTSRPV